ncbi:MAG TPA: LptA/OstA family protein, partial [Candidatus Acidoferrum sp.]|nr:LptA/OstA family protein [Candidatus Acidoferrum sp.]
AAHKGASQKRKNGASAPVLWRVQAAKVGYSSDAGKMMWSGGVKAHSSEGDISSDTLELSFLKGADGRQTLERAIASGGVRIEQNGRIGTADRGEYIASEGKFVLSGGEPAIADASGNRTTGHELTFFLANDSIVVDSGTKPQTQTMPH